MQANDSRCASSRAPRRATLAHRSLAVLALLANAAAMGAALPHFPGSLTRPAPAPHVRSPAFATAPP
eukprot:4064834-Pleurochrysis_carterae.AAC.1